jgi:selenocysteine-specific elongation factor
MRWNGTVVSGPVAMRVVGTAGHVDHGKSTLVRAITGMEPDRWEEERRRGLTIDLGFVWTDLDTAAGALKVAFVDVPGHERFVGNMVAGAGAVPSALLVVAADDGWSAQTQEHVAILDLLGVPAVLVAVTKADVAGPARTDEVTADVERRLGGTSLAGAPVVAVDSVTGVGIERLEATLAERLGSMPPPADRGRPRLWIDRAFTIAGAGTVITGTLSGGSLALGDTVMVAPDRRVARIRGIQSLGEGMGSVAPGARVAVNLAGVALDEVARGHVLLGCEGATASALASGWLLTDEFEVSLRSLPGHELGRRGAWHLHVGTAETRVDIRPLLGMPIETTGHARLRTAASLPLVAGDRFVVRDAGRRTTAGGGTVLDPDPPPVRGEAARLERDAELDRIAAAEGPQGRLSALVGAAPYVRERAAAFAATGLPMSAPLPSGLVDVTGFLMTVPARDQWAETIITRAREGSAAEGGVARRELIAAADHEGCPADVAAALVERLDEEGQLHRVGSLYVSADRSEVVATARNDRQAALVAALSADPFAPPDLDEVRHETGTSHEEVNELVGRGEVVLCGRIAFSGDAIARAVAALEELDGERFTTAEARQALGTSRRYAIPLLEHLDARGVTEFDGTTRRLRSRDAP